MVNKKDTYVDTFTDKHFAERRTEVVEELRSIADRTGLSLDGERIVEIGAGAGGETAGLRDFYPNKHIVAVDMDKRVLESHARTIANEVICADALSILNDGREASKLFGRADTVIALRTSVVVAYELLRKLGQAGFHGILVTSYIQESERGQEGEKVMRAIGNLVFDSHGAIRIVPLKESRWHNERAYVKSFGKLVWRG